MFSFGVAPRPACATAARCQMIDSHHFGGSVSSACEPVALRSSCISANDRADCYSDSQTRQREDDDCCLAANKRSEPGRFGRRAPRKMIVGHVDGRAGLSICFRRRPSRSSTIAIISAASEAVATDDCSSSSSRRRRNGEIHGQLAGVRAL